MGCGCGKSKDTFVVTTKDGQTIEVHSRLEAIAMVTQKGGTWQQKVEVGQ